MKKFIITKNCGLLLISWFLYIYSNNFSNFGIAQKISIIIVISHLINITYFKAFNNLDWFNPYCLFTTSLVLIHFFFPAVSSIYPIILESNELWIKKDMVARGCAICAIGYFALNVGYLKSFSSYRVSAKFVANRLDFVQIRRGCNNLYFVSAAIFIVLIISGGESYLRGAYASGNESGLFGYAYFLTQIFLYLAISLDLYSLSTGSGVSTAIDVFRRCNKVVFGGAFLYFAWNIYIGDRGPLIHLSILVFGGYSVFIKRIKFLSIITVVISGVFLLAALSLLRTRDSRHSIDDRAAEALQIAKEREWYYLTKDLSISGRTVYITLDEVVEGGPWLGKGWVMDLAGLVPFLRGSIQGLLRRFDMDQTSSDYCTSVIYGSNYAVAGAGTTLVADSLLNFSSTGVMCVFGLVGFFLGRIEIWMKNKPSILSFVFYMSVSLNSFYWPRSSLFLHTQFVLLTVILLFLVNRLFPFADRLTGRDSKFAKHA